MSEEKKIFIDEDWKSQVEAEKKALNEPAEKQPDAPAGEDTLAGDADEQGDMEMPPASFDLLVTSLVSEAMISLGQMPHPLTGKAGVQRHQAKYLIDMIGVLKEKTEGNISAEETSALGDVLHQLRMAFVAVTKVGDLEEGLRLANNTPFGLTAGLFSGDEEEIERWFNGIEAGVTYVNRAAGATTGAWPDIQSFGGWKGSGTSGAGGGGPWYLRQFLREQSRTLVK